MTRASEARAHAVFRHVFPDATVIEEIPNRSNMNPTDEAKIEDGFATDYSGAFAGAAAVTADPQTVTYPETPANPYNHAFTLSLVPDKAPFLVIRASSTQELLGTMDALEADGVYAAMGAAQAAFRAHAEQGRGPAPTAPAAAPQAPAQGFQAPAPHAFQGNTPPPFGPNVSVPGAPGYQGPPAPQGYAPPAAPPAQAGQWGGAQSAAPQAAPQGWFKLNVPYPGGKDQLHALAAQYNIPKGNPTKGGMYNFWSAPTKAWYCAPEVAQAFGQFTPMPA